MSSAETSDTKNPLLDLLRMRIADRGPLAVDEYMRLCLGHPVHGYWQRADSIGARGDFITAPEISQVFGELIGLWCTVVWQAIGQPAPVRLVELGPGRGTLMLDALRAAKVVPEFLDAATVHLAETSRALRNVQGQTLGLPPPTRDSPYPLRDSPPPCGEGRGVGGTRTSKIGESPPPSPSPTRGEGEAAGGGVASIDWHNTIEEVPSGPAIVIANEFLDALPIRQLVHVDGGWHERVVDVDAQGALCFAVGQREGPTGEPDTPPPQQGDILELRPAEDALLATLARRQAPLIALFIDYGPAQAGYGDTLQAVRQHAWIDPLADPGCIDLTAHVQFARLARAARTAGLAADGPMLQAEFLGRLGIAERAARLMSANPAIAHTIETGVQRLLSPSGMGGLFKVMAVRSPSLPPAPPFG